MRKKADMRAGRSLAVPFRTYIVFLENRPDVKLAVISPPETLLNQIDRLFASTLNVIRITPYQLSERAARL
jgi:hypothetical protein